MGNVQLLGKERKSMTVDNTSTAYAPQVQSAPQNLRQYVPKRTPEIGVDSLTGKAVKPAKEGGKKKRFSGLKVPKFAKKPKIDRASKKKAKLKNKKEGAAPVRQTAPSHKMAPIAKRTKVSKTPRKPKLVDRRKTDRRARGRKALNAQNDNSSFQSLNRYLRYSYISVFLLAVVLGGWSVLAKIQGAVIAAGTVAVEGKPKIVQHLDGGIVSVIAVKEGDFVEKGQTVLKLDSTILNANLDAAETNYYENKALIDRLLAEKSGQNNITWSTTLSGQRRNGRVALAMSGQEQLFRARKNALSGELDQLSQRIAQYSDEDAGVVTEISHTQRELSLVDTELSKLRTLLSQNLVPRSRVTQLEREKTRLVNAVSKLETRRVSLGNSMTEAEINMTQVQRLRDEQVLTELRQAQTHADSYSEALKTVSKKNSHVTIQAPVSGIIHDMTISTVGGVIAPGQEIMQIIPKRDRLIIKAQIQPQDIDQVVLGQTSNVVFSAFNQQTAPELEGVVSYISADTLTDPITGFTYFTVDVDVADTEIAKLHGQSLIAGMPADVFIQTEEISVMDYLLGPLKDTLSKTMRDG